ncbi:MAG: phage tail protein, partial [Candidatus Obscuribacterales bacterium]|nr:phage tail protein [Candidatus Obscuribacterales bacterium]
IGFKTLTVAHGLPININFYKATQNADPASQSKTFAFTPYFEFVSFIPEGGNSPVRYESIQNPDGTKNIHMRLACYDESLKNLAGASIAQIEKDQTVNIASILVLPIYQLTISEANSKLSVTLPPNPTAATKLSLTPIIEVFFQNLSPADANALASRIQSGATNFYFAYSFKKANTSLNAVAVTMKDIQKTSVFQQLSGNGSAISCTRNGLVNVGTKIAQQLDVFSYTESDEASALVDRVINLFFDKATYKKDIDFTKKENLATLSKLGIDQNGADFEAQRIQSTHDLVTSSKDYNDVNKKLRGGGGALGYGPFSASGNFQSNDEVTKAVKETFSHDWTGNNWKTIPKTVCVYQNNASDFDSVSTVRQVSVKPTFYLNTDSMPQPQSFPTTEQIKSAIVESSTDNFVLVPLGSVVPYAGSAALIQSKGTNWMLCDGKPLSKDEYPDLYKIIGTAHGDGRDSNNTKISDFNLPDYRGYFLRGVDSGAGRDPESGNRAQAKLGGNTGDHVGSVQTYATALPHNNSFKTTAQGGHSHTLQGHHLEADSGSGFNGSGLKSDSSPAANWDQVFATSSSGNHEHLLVGGDSETRPNNVNVNWLIRVK